MKVVFRVDSASIIGNGHLTRCITLAEALNDQDVQISFVCRELAGNSINILQEKNMPVAILPAIISNQDKSKNVNDVWLGVSQAQDAEQSIQTLDGKKTNWLVLDHYGLDLEWEQMMRPYCDHLLVIEDLANRKHDCDLLLDQNYSLGAEQRYQKWVPPTCKMLLGQRYALLKKEFQILRQQKTISNKFLRKLLVFFTSGDDQGETLKAMQGILLFGKAEKVDIVVSNANQDILNIKAICQVQNWGFHCQVNYMPALIAQADLAIGAGGSSNWERCALGVPALIVILAQNQADIAAALDVAGAVVNLGWHSKLKAVDYEKALNSIDAERLTSLSDQSFKLVDAKGAQRVVEIMLSNSHFK